MGSIFERFLPEGREPERQRSSELSLLGLERIRERQVLEITNDARENGRRLVEALRTMHGGTLVLPEGKYDLPPGRIKLGNDSGEPVRILGAGVGKTILTGGSDNSVLHIDHSKNFSIENIQFEARDRGSRKHPLHDLRITDSENVNIKNCYFGQTRPKPGDDNSNVQFGGACHNVELKNNRFDALGANNTKTHCIYFGEGNRQTHRGSDHIRVISNYMTYNGGECGAMVQFNSNGVGKHHDVLVEGNTFRSGSRIGRNQDWGGGGVALAGVDGVRICSNDMLIARGAFIEVWGEGVSNAEIENNEFDLVGVPRSRNEFVISGPVRNVRWQRSSERYAAIRNPSDILPRVHFV